MEPIDRLSDGYTFPDFVPAEYCAIDGESMSLRIELLDRDRPPKVGADRAARFAGRFTAFGRVRFAIGRAVRITSRWWSPPVGSAVRGAA
jgi:hypothetical protein